MGLKEKEFTIYEAGEVLIMPDILDIKIEIDGTVSITTDKISDTRHVSADDILTDLEDMLGGPSKTVKRDHKRHVSLHRHQKA